MYRKLVLLVVLFAGCSNLLPTPAPVIDENDAKAKAVISILVTELEQDSQPNPQPDNAPKPGDKCPTCNGKGQVGDGRVFSDCMDCNGTGKVPFPKLSLPEVEEIIEDTPFKPATTEVEAVIIKKKLVVYSASWCIPCQVWKNTYSEEFKRIGVELVPLNMDEQIKPVIIPGGKEVTSIPFFVYYEDDKPIKWFQGSAVSPDYMRSQGIKF